MNLQYLALQFENNGYAFTDRGFIYLCRLRELRVLRLGRNEASRKVVQRIVAKNRLYKMWLSRAMCMQVTQAEARR